MLESYEEGQRLQTGDFADDFYMPEGKYEYCEIMRIDDDTVELRYHTVDGEDEDMLVTRDEMAHMLGWDLSADDNRFEQESRVPSPDEYGMF